MKMTITVDDELYWKFQEELAKRRRIQKDAVEEALRGWTEGAQGSKPQLVATGDARLHTLLTEILGTKDESARAAVERALELTHQEALARPKGSRRTK